MYKVVITNKYKLYDKYNKLLGEYNNVQSLADFSIDFIRTRELITAINFMLDTTHNVTEFGGRGYFTVSYYDEAYDE